MLNYTDLLGINFKYGGKNKEEGFDCWNLCKEIYNRLGKELPSFDYIVQEVVKDNNFMYDVVHRKISNASVMFEKLNKPEPFCLVTFFIRPPYTTHIGVVLDDCVRFIHILPKSSVSVERLDSIEWEKRITGFWRLKNATR